ncbi:iron ABC transporter permease [Tropicimonas sp. IMCC34011]|uniref:ABC transporter permease n=1 Tax=Tropicimonas sp. IMCC34011 TaxID=2248759 RepID=UPI000E250531|nr:iron ABC transporter permease [Tropicimonas sp. IMCC34011]
MTAAAPETTQGGTVAIWSRAAYAVSALVLVWLILLPFGAIFLTSFLEGDGGLSAYAEFLASRSLRTATWNSILVAMGLAGLSAVIGTALAFGVARTRMRFKGLVRVTMILALISPEFLLAMGYILLAGPNVGYANIVLRELFSMDVRTGPFDIYTLWGLVFTALPSGVSFVFLALVPAFGSMDPALEDAARLKGASPLRTIATVTLPLARPAILAGTLLAFATSLAMYGPPEMLGIPVLTVSIRESLLGLDFDEASVAAVVLVGISILALLLQRYGIRHPERYRTISGKAFAARTLDLGWPEHLLTAFGLLYVGVALILPYGTMLAVSLMKSIGNGFTADNWTLANFSTILGDDSIRKAVFLSLRLAAASAAVVAVFGVIVAYVVVRTRQPGRAILDYISVLPLAVPGTALAFALIVIYLSEPFRLLGFYGTPAILLLAYLARFIPLGVRNSQSALLQVSPELEEASRVFGAGELSTLLRITLPLILPAFVYTFLLVFVLAIPELSASIVLRGFDTQTIATSVLSVWNGNGGLAVACAYGISIFVTVSLLFLLALLARRLAAAWGGQADAAPAATH